MIEDIRKTEEVGMTTTRTSQMLSEAMMADMTNKMEITKMN